MEFLKSLLFKWGYLSNEIIIQWAEVLNVPEISKISKIAWCLQTLNPNLYGLVDLAIIYS